MKTMALVLLILVGCDRAESEVKQLGEWKLLGSVGDANSGVSAYKRTDPDTGNIIYVTTKGGIFVLKASQKE